MLKPRLKIDLDGVFVDFIRGVFRWYGKTMPYNEVRWDIDQKFVPGGAKEFWKPLGYDFWANLEWTPQGKELYSRICEVVGPERIIITSSPCQTRGCIDGKIDWIEKNMPDLKRRYAITPVKHELPGKRTMLLDDYEVNIEKYIHNGGQALLFPQPWNHARIHLLDDHGTIDLDAFMSNFTEQWNDL